MKTGQVSFEFRNYVRDPFDITATLIARCGGPSSFFGLTRGLFAEQKDWIGKIQAAPPEQQQALMGMPPQQQFVAIAKLAGFPQWAAMRGVPAAKSAACLADEAAMTKLVQMNSDATTQYPEFPGTPTFILNGKLLENTADLGARLSPSSGRRSVPRARSGKPKLKIRRLKLSGFKSFVEPAELRIEPGLTGVVGPNGCGKSNLFEAIRWVMGEGSPKSLRGGGMDDVIFAGTATRPPRDFAEVTMLVEREAGEGGASEDGESEVTRRIERGAGSAYRIDGRDVRAKDVSLLFADAATGAHSPALVSQGRIGAVIAAKPTERRLMLEEAAGIAGLHARRKDAEQKLRATEANLTRLDELLSDQEARAAALGGRPRRPSATAP